MSVPDRLPAVASRPSDQEVELDALVVLLFEEPEPLSDEPDDVLDPPSDEPDDVLGLLEPPPPSPEEPFDPDSVPPVDAVVELDDRLPRLSVL